MVSKFTFKKQSKRIPSQSLATYKLKHFGYSDIKHWLKQIPLHKMQNNHEFEKIQEIYKQIANTEDNKTITDLAEKAYLIFKPYLDVINAKNFDGVQHYLQNCLHLILIHRLLKLNTKIQKIIKN